MATVDSLDIQISAQVNKANASLTTLINRLDRVSASLSGVNSRGLATMGAGVNKLANAMSNFSANTKTADFSRLSRNLASISKIDTSNFSDISSKMSQLSSAFNSFGTVPDSAQQIGEFARNISKLGNKGITNAITNIPQLAVAMRDLMQTLSTAPAVSQNVIQMTNALANLASQGGKVGTASRTMVSGLNKTSSAMNRAKRSSLSLAAAFGKFYATWFLVIRGIKGFMKSVESTTDYIEAFNYYTVAFGKIASEFDKKWEEYGSDGARNYANAFVTEMNATLGKLSGIQVELSDDYTKGILIETGVKNLGLNIQEITQYASQLASVTNSIGQTGEVSLAAAKSMTMLAGDISSLFNIDYGSVAQNLQSGLIGQSRALYKYGIDITNATLQTKAYELGLSKTVSEMSQAEKMQLRLLVILQSSKVAWGDLANTISSPSNMIRQFKNNVKELGMVFGQLFIPVLQKVMPIINGVTIALKRLMVAFANFLGIKIDFDAFGQGYSDLGDEADDLADSIEGIGKAAKKATAGLRAFDELKVINLPDTSTKGTGAGGDMIDLTQQILDATSEYERVWNEAFAKMENTAQEWADRIEKYLEPVKKIFKDFAIGDFFQAGQDVSSLVVSITDFFARAIDNVNWYGIGENIGKFLEGVNWTAVLRSVGKLIWEAINASVKLWAGSFRKSPIVTAIITAFGLMKFTKLGDIVRPKIAKAIINTKLITALTTAWTSLGGLGGILTTDLATIIGAGTAAEIGLAIGTAIIGGIIAAIGGWSFGQWLYEKISGETIDMSWAEQFEEIKKSFSDGSWKGALKIWGDDIYGGLLELGKIEEEWAKNTWNKAKEIWGAVSGWFDSHVIQPVAGFFSAGFDKIFGFFKNTWNKAKEIWGAVSGWFDSHVIQPVQNAWRIATNAIGDFFSGLWSGIKKGVGGAMNVMISAVEGAINFVVDAINGIVKGFNTIVKWAGDLIGADWSGVSLVERVTLGRIDVNTYATGGFPEDGWFRASHGEIMGRFDNGQSVVANNMQITEGISLAVQEGNRENNYLMRQEIDLLKKQNELLTGILQKEYGITTTQIGQAAREYSMEYLRANGEPAYIS